MINTFCDIIKIFEDGENLERNSSLFNKKTYNLDRIKTFLNFIGNPEKNLKIIHIAGSKGKGTITHILGLLTEDSGHKCGIFTSPHVYDYRERFMLASKFFKDEEYIQSGRELENHIINFAKTCNERLTTFEKYFAFALLLFKNTNCEYAVLETGLGGRLDATNAVNSFVEILTTIEKEHTAILGKSLEKIAYEKAKIIKPNSLVFALDNKKCVNKIFTDEALLTNSKIFFLSALIGKIKHSEKNLKEKITFCDKDGCKYSYIIPTPGVFFAKDSALAIMCAKHLGLLGNNYQKCLANLYLPSRFELRYLNSNIPLIFDGAHTVLSIKSTLKTFKKNFKGITTLVFGCASDKNVEKIAEILAPKFENIIIQKPGDFKTSDVNGIYETFLKIKKEKNLDFVLKKNTDPQITIAQIEKFNAPALITGSFYLCDEIAKRIK